VCGAYYLQGGVGMSPTWAGWAVLYWGLLSITACWVLFLSAVCVRGAWRWWQGRRWHRW